MDIVYTELNDTFKYIDSTTLYNISNLQLIRVRHDRSDIYTTFHIASNVHFRVQIFETTLQTKLIEQLELVSCTTIDRSYHHVINTQSIETSGSI